MVSLNSKTFWKRKTAAAQKKLFRYFLSEDASCYLVEHAHNWTCRYISSFIYMHLLTWCIIKAIMKSTHWHISEYVNSPPWVPVWAVQTEAYSLNMKIFIVSWWGLHCHHLLSPSHLYQFLFIIITWIFAAHSCDIDIDLHNFWNGKNDR